MITDEQIIDGIRCGDINIMKHLYESYYVLLCNFAYRFTKDKDPAKDIVSDIFLNLWLKREKIDISTSLRSYLYVSVRNHCFNYLKTANRNYLRISEDDDETLNIESEDQFYKAIESDEEVEIILSKLPDRKRLVFKLKVIDGLKYKEIAEILSISVNTVQNHMVEAYKILSKKLSNGHK
ncbi:MAG: RNA polymerase sigma-70 factor [Bacteroidota bacterium]